MTTSTAAALPGTALRLAVATAGTMCLTDRCACYSPITTTWSLSLELCALLVVDS